MSEDDWVTDAMEDDSLVAELLLSFNHVSPPLPSERLAPALHVGWIIRQPRSKYVMRQAEVEKKNEPMRASPTTPLSWSGATSASGGGTEGFEESSRLPKTLDGARSEIPVKNDEGARKKAKSTKRKKTLAELKGEETLLLNERRNLKSALISLRLNVEKQRATNERLKRVKAQQKVTVACGSAPSISYQPQVQPSTLTSNANLTLHIIENLGSSCFLPDLNLPFGEDSCSEVLQEMR